MSGGGLISVRTELVQDVLVGRIAARVRELESAAAAPERLLREELLPAVEDRELGVRLARAGYFMRLVETELFEPARRPAPFRGRVRELLEETGAEGPAVARLARELAAAEPLGRPAPGDERAASWAVPGPGGHVRHLTARRLVAERAGGRAKAERLKRDVMFGFFVRCCEEALPANAG